MGNSDISSRETYGIQTRAGSIVTGSIVTPNNGESIIFSYFQVKESVL